MLIRREVTAILAKLPEADLIRLRELLKKPHVWRRLVEAVEKAAGRIKGAAADDYPEMPPCLDRRLAVSRGEEAS
jgi:hypothetical protein